MAQTITVDVTEEDIQGGEPRSACGCPVYLAIARLVAPSSKIRIAVCPPNASFYGRGFECEYKGALPLAAIEFIRSFDNGKRPRPVSFALEIPNWVELLPQSPTS